MLRGVGVRAHRGGRLGAPVDLVSVTSPSPRDRPSSAPSHAARCVACQGVCSHPVPVALVGKWALPGAFAREYPWCAMDEEPVRHVRCTNCDTDCTYPVRFAWMYSGMR